MTLACVLRGNLTKRGGTEYYWDSRDRLTEVNNNGTISEYKYDLMGRRVAKKVGAGSWKWYFYHGLQALAEGTGTSDKTYYTTNGRAIGGIILLVDFGRERK